MPAREGGGGAALHAEHTTAAKAPLGGPVKPAYGSGLLPPDIPGGNLVQDGATQPQPQLRAPGPIPVPVPAGCPAHWCQSAVRPTRLGLGESSLEQRELRRQGRGERTRRGVATEKRMPSLFACSLLLLPATTTAPRDAPRCTRPLRHHPNIWASPPGVRVQPGVRRLRAAFQSKQKILETSVGFSGSS